MRELFFTVLGMSLLLVVAYDLKGTVLHSRGRNGPLSEAICRAIWRMAKSLAFRLPRTRRHGLLNAVGPILMPVLIIVFITLLVFGFALIYYPRMASQFAIDPRAVNSPFANSLYFSGITLTTVGYGDIAPITTLMRSIALIESASGFALISLAVTYLITVYGALGRKRAAALTFYHQAERGADAVSFILRHYVGGRFIGIASNLRIAARDLQELLESHIEHPIVHYFHPMEVFKSTPRMLFLSLEICSLIKSCLDEDEYAEVFDHPEVHNLQLSARHVLGEFGTLLPLDDRAGAIEGDESQREQRWEARFRQSIKRLKEAGIKTRADKAKALEAYKSERNEWEPLLNSIAHYLGYEWNEVAGDRDLLYASDETLEEPRIEAYR